jgi:hypothetical protein
MSQERVPVKMQVTFTATGHPVPVEKAREVYGKSVQPADQPGWFWVFATPMAAEAMGKYGHRVVGTETTSVSPASNDKPVHVEQFPYHSVANGFCSQCAARVKVA